MSMITKLHVEIEDRIDEASQLKLTDKEYTSAVDSIGKLMDRAIEIDKLERSEAREEKQMKEDRKNRLIRNIIDAGAIVLPLGVTIWGAVNSWMFEANGGMITTGAGRKFMDRLMSKK